MLKKVVRKLINKITDKKGASEFVAVAVLIIIVLVIGALIFFPGLFDYFKNTVFSGMTTATDNLFNFQG